MLESRDRRFVMFGAVTLVVLMAAWSSWTTAVAPSTPAAKPAPGNGIFRTLAGAEDFTTGSMDGVTVDDAGALVLDPDAAPAAPVSQGTYLAPVWNTPVGVSSVVASWAADTPSGTWLTVEARAMQADTWTKWYTMGVWASDTSVVQRHNAGEQEDAAGRVDTDDLRLKRPASAVQVRLTLFSSDPGLTPRVRRLSVVATGEGGEGASGSGGPGVAQPYRRAWGVDLKVPELRQNDFPEGGGWCSPTSVAMIMAYWADRTGNDEWDRSVPEVADGVRDFEYGGTGNWVFNTAYAASLGLDTYVTRFDSLAGVERWIAVGVPVAINVEFEKGELDGAPMPRSDGHIIVVRGFDRRGNPIANDPAGRADQGEKVRTVYDRAQLERAWQGRPAGTVYIIYPPGNDSGS